MRSSQQVGRWTVSATAEQIEVTSNSPRPDPAWVHTDTQGHVHRWSENLNLPTLRWVQDEEDYVAVDADGYVEEYPGEGHYECVLCGEHVDPGMRGPSPLREFISGPVSVTINGRDLSGNEVEMYLTSQEQYSDLMQQVQDADDRDAVFDRFLSDHPDQARTTFVSGF